MKIERAEKNYRQKKLISQKKFLVQNKVVAQQFRVAARVLWLFWWYPSQSFDIRLEKCVRKCANILEDNDLIGKLSAGDMIALDAMYHSTCLLNLYKECDQKEREVTYDNTDKVIYGQILSELAHYVKQVAKDDIKTIN